MSAGQGRQPWPRTGLAWARIWPALLACMNGFARHRQQNSLTHLMRNGCVTHQVKPRCRTSSGTGHRYMTVTCESFLCGFQGSPAGPLAPPTRRARLRSRWRSHDGGANAGRLARKAETPGRHDIQQSPGFSRGEWCACSRYRYCPGRAEPVKSAFGVGSADLRLLTEPARKSRSSQLSGAWTRVAHGLDVQRQRQDDGQNRNQACFRSATQVKGWMTPAGVMCSSRSWLMTRHSPPSSAVTCAGLLGGEQDPLAEQR
jgi:hypothetical protein